LFHLLNIMEITLELVVGMIFFYQWTLCAEYYGNHLVKRLRAC